MQANGATAFALFVWAALVQGLRDASKPNVILVLTDDEDRDLAFELPSTNTLQWMRDRGATFLNYFVTTPVCCPSRTAMLSGKYAHNLDDQNQGWCGNFISNGETNRTFAVSLQKAGYRTGMFGKFMNQDCGGGESHGAMYIPKGWGSWFAMCNDNTYFSMKWNDNGVLNQTGAYEDENGTLHNPPQPPQSTTRTE